MNRHKPKVRFYKVDTPGDDAGSIYASAEIEPVDLSAMGNRYIEIFTPSSCEGCRWYHDWFGVCCNGESEQRGDVSERCPLYDGGDRDEDLE